MSKPIFIVMANPEEFDDPAEAIIYASFNKGKAWEELEKLDEGSLKVLEVEDVQG